MSGSEGKTRGRNQKDRLSTSEKQENDGSHDHVGGTVHGHAHRAVSFIDRFRIRMAVCERSRGDCQKGKRRQKSQKLPTNVPEEIIHNFLPPTMDTADLLGNLSR